MSFDQREGSRSEGQPITLFLFMYGNTPDSYYAYTDAEQSVDFTPNDYVGQVTFTPIPIQRAEITSSGTLDNTTMDIRTPFNAELASQFRLHPPSQIVTCTVWEGHEEDPDFRVVWVGRILGSSREGNEAVYTGEPVSTAMKRAGLRRNYQYQCPHVLYSQGEGLCNADRQRATFAFTVQGVAGAIVTLPDGWQSAEMQPKFIGGIATWIAPDGRTEERSVIKLADSRTIVLSGFASGLSAGVELLITWGCDHRYDSDCTNLHDNVLNFGGDPWIPTKNPTGITNNYY